MSRAAGIITKLNTTLNRVGPQDRIVYKRVLTQTGGDSLIGHPSSVTHVDTVLSPQPLYQRIGRNIVGDQITAEIIQALNSQHVADDFMLTLSPTAMSMDDLGNKNVMIVLKDAAGNEELYRITDYEPIAFQGTVVMIAAYIRSTTRPS